MKEGPDFNQKGRGGRSKRNEILMMMRITNFDLSGFSI